MTTLSSESILLIDSTNAQPPTHSFPADWPVAGPIDLAIHDLPHSSSTLEWWYLNSHLTLADDRPCSLFASFFRMAIGRDETTGQIQYGHTLTWAISDVKSQQYYTDSLVDPRAPKIGLDTIDKGEDKTDPLLQRALREVLVKGNVALPDRMLSKDAFVSLESLSLDYDGNTLVKEVDGSYRLTLVNVDGSVGAELSFYAQTPPVRQGDEGVVMGTSGEDMFYYFMPQCRVEGTLTLDGKKVDVATASGWYDHEFGKSTDEETPEARLDHKVAWNWTSVQLVNGYQISAYELFDNNAGEEICGRWLVLIDPKGNSRQHDDFTLLPLKYWTSSRTFTSYPTVWQLTIPSADISLVIEADFPKQEFNTIIAKRAFWEGRMSVTGTFAQEPIYGLAYLERSGFGLNEKLTDFFKAVTKETRKSIEALLPLNPSDAQLRKLVASDENGHYLQGLDPGQYSRALIKPIREMIDRGGKSWRSYAALACLDLVGGDSQKYMNWLAWPELLHTGSLIVDDVQDKSDIRRGGPSCHAIYGEATAINAGNACYFLGELLVDSTLSDSKKLKLYTLYFETLRAAHAGQAIDIDGFDAMMPEVVGYGRGALLEDRILSVHRLKSAVPVSSLAQLGVIMGEGTPEEAQLLGNFFEAMGLAFQIIDDVLNLRGFENNLKSRGEDITCGKITLPVAKAMGRLGWPARRDLWDTIQTKPSDPAVIDHVIDQLEACGAIEACKKQAEELVEEAWRKLDARIPDSDVKIRLRAFSWYVLERHY
ncbi:polyprenyl synthetase family protein [Spirosoma fluminis]